MDIRFENKEAFTVCGYLIETSDVSYEADTRLLRDKYEDKLRTFTKNDTEIYGVTWYCNIEDVTYYLLGIEKLHQASIGEDSVEIPAATFAVATIPAEMSVYDAWIELFEKELPSVGYSYTEFTEKCFELYRNGVLEIWVPVVKAEKLS